ncbi:MAG: hypothetical protein KJO79_00340, partial [Verrucomicrobiae bacterium]|nr:hypothetical protein [Verrucomicrobiae bacterium]
MTDEESQVASLLGIDRIDAIHVMSVAQVPNPLKWIFGWMETCGVDCATCVGGMTLGRGIYLA